MKIETNTEPGGPQTQNSELTNLLLTEKESPSRVNAKLYKINDALLESDDDVNDIIDGIVRNYTEQSDHDFEEKSLKSGLSKLGYNYRFFTFSTEMKVPNWLDFAKSIVEDENDIQELGTKHSSFVLFLYNDSEIYAITKGYHGHHVVENEVDRFFGLNVLSKLVDSRETVIRQIEQLSVFGVELGSQRYFRDNYKLGFENNFGKIYKSLLASLNEDKFEILGIEKKREDYSAVSISGGASLYLSSSFDFGELELRCFRISELLNNGETGFDFSMFSVVTDRDLRRNNLKEELEDALLQDAWVNYEKLAPFDFVHPDAFEYFGSNELQFHRGENTITLDRGATLSFAQIITTLHKGNLIEAGSEEGFMNSMRECMGRYTKGEDNVPSNSYSLMEWLGGEVRVADVNYFKFDKTWYRYTKSFDDFMDESIARLDLNQFKTEPFLEEWDKSDYETEHAYLDSLRTDNNKVLTDCAFYKNIEISDFLRFERGEVILYHVKEGMGRNLRVLLDQTLNAVRFLAMQRRSDDEGWIEEYYNVIIARNYEGREDDILSYELFREKIKNNKIRIVFAYASKSKKSIADELIASRSSVAKFAMINYMHSMRNFGFEFSVQRIQLVK